MTWRNFNQRNSWRWKSHDSDAFRKEWGTIPGNKNHELWQGSWDMTYTQNNAPFRAIFLKIPPHILLHQLLWSPPYKDIEKMEEDIFFDCIILNPFCQYMGPIEWPLLFKSQPKLSDRTGIFWGQEGSLFFSGNPINMAWQVPPDLCTSRSPSPGSRSRWVFSSSQNWQGTISNI